MMSLLCTFEEVIRDTHRISLSQAQHHTVKLSDDWSIINVGDNLCIIPDLTFILSGDCVHALEACCCKREERVSHCHGCNIYAMRVCIPHSFWHYSSPAQSSLNSSVCDTSVTLMSPLYIYCENSECRYFHAQQKKYAELVCKTQKHVKVSMKLKWFK